MYKTKGILIGDVDPDFLEEVISQSFAPYGGNGIYFKEVLISTSDKNLYVIITCRMSNGDTIELSDDGGVLQIKSENFGIIHFNSPAANYIWEDYYSSIYTLYSHIILSLYGIEYDIPKFFRERLN